MPCQLRKNEELSNMKNQKNKDIIDETFNNMAGKFVEILNEAMSKEREKTEYWKRKAWILANKRGLCFKHDKQETAENFNDTGATFDDYIKEAVECGDCNYKKLEGIK
jgi:hypothetical protein